MRFHRPERISKLIMEYLNELLIRDVETPGTLVTITNVDVAKDLSRAAVRISVLPSDKANIVLKKFDDIRGYLQYKLLRKLNIRPLPKIYFEIDRGPEQAAAVERALLKNSE
ncbi:MAG: ribosome-binding factor A [bacterium]|nr:ribosome-binding factor A [bacterium]